MDDQSKICVELLIENALLKKRIQELEELEERHKKMEEALVKNEKRFIYYKNLNDALAKSEKRFRSLIESAPEAIVVHVEGRFVYANPAMLSLWGVTDLNSVIGQDVMEGVAPEYRDKVQKSIDFQRETGKAAPRLDIELVREDGSRIKVETTSIAIQYEGKEAHLVFVRENTERIDQVSG